MKNTPVLKWTRGAALCVLSATASLHAQNNFWALDEEDDNRIWGWSDYTSDTSAVDHGIFHYNDGGTWKAFGTRQIEAMALTDGNIGYMLDERDGLHSFNFGLLTPGSSNVYQVNTINNSVAATGEALAYNHLDGMLYLAAVVGSAKDTDTNADKLYQINPATGAIVAILDNDTHDGISSGADIETLAWDSITGRLIGVDNSNDEIVHLTLENGNNSVLSNYNSHLGGSKDFEGSGILPDVVPEPSSTALLGLGGFALMLRRRRRG